MFQVTNDIHPLNFGGRTFWMWSITFRLKDAPAGMLDSFEVQGMATSLDAAYAEMIWAERLTELKLRFIGYSINE